MTDSQKAREFLASQKHMVIAVVLANGSPWAVPVAIKRWEGNEFEWESRLDTQHSIALHTHEAMSIVAFQKQADAEVGVYARGRGVCIEDRGNGFGRYRFVAEEAWMNDESFVKRKVDLA